MKTLSRQELKKVNGGLDPDKICSCSCTGSIPGEWSYGLDIQPSLGSLKKDIAENCGSETAGTCAITCTNW